MIKSKQRNFEIKSNKIRKTFFPTFYHNTGSNLHQYTVLMLGTYFDYALYSIKINSIEIMQEERTWTKMAPEFPHRHHEDNNQVEVK